MTRETSQPLLNYLTGFDSEVTKEKEDLGEITEKENSQEIAEKEAEILEIEEETEKEEKEGKGENEEFEGEDYGGVDNGAKTDELIEQMQRMVLHNQTRFAARVDEQGIKMAQLEEQQKAKLALEELLEEQLDYYHARSDRALFPTRPKDVAQILMPDSSPAQELASLAWFGDWRPSAMLQLLRTLARHTSSTFSAAQSDSDALEHLLPQLLHDVQIEETVLEEEMGEIQATCILYLPFGATRWHRMGSAGLPSIRAEFKKMDRVIAKAQHLRSKTLDMVANKVLSQTDAAEFLVAFSGIQDMIHQFAENQRLHKGPVSVPTKSLRTAKLEGTQI